jgi:hypothetical protein
LNTDVLRHAAPRHHRHANMQAVVTPPNTFEEIRDAVIVLDGGDLL